MSDIRYSTFPRTAPPPDFTLAVVDVFEQHMGVVSTIRARGRLNSDQVLAEIREDLVGLGFDVESGKHQAEKIRRPVLFGENSKPELQYEIDAYHAGWECGLEVEAGRAWMGNAIYRDLIQACVMVQVRHLVLVVPQAYRYMSSGKETTSTDYDNTKAEAEALFAHSRVQLPYDLLLIGY